MVIAAVFVGKRQPRTERHLRTDDAMAAEELFLAAEHVHGAALTLGKAAAPSGKLGHHALRIHAAGQHVAVVAVGGDHLVALLLGHLHADNHRFLANVEVAEAADEAHAIELTGLLLEPADEQHLAIGVQLLFAGKTAVRQIGLFALHLLARHVGGLHGHAFLLPFDSPYIALNR